MMHKSEFKKKLHNAYANVVESLPKIKIGIKYFIILGTIYLGIDAFTNYDLSHFILQEAFFLLNILGIVLLAALYHRRFGNWHVHENNVGLTKEYVSLKVQSQCKSMARDVSKRNSSVRNNNDTNCTFQQTNLILDVL